MKYATLALVATLATLSTVDAASVTTGRVTGRKSLTATHGRLAAVGGYAGTLHGAALRDRYRINNAYDHGVYGPRHLRSWNSPSRHLSHRVCWGSHVRSSFLRPWGSTLRFSRDGSIHRVSRPTPGL